MRTLIVYAHLDESGVCVERQQMDFMGRAFNLRADFFGHVSLSSVVGYVEPEIRTTRVKMRRESNGC